MVDSHRLRGFCALLAAFSLATGPAATPARAQTATIDGLARSVSLMRQIAATCSGDFNVDRDLAERSEKAFAQTGETAFGKAAFDKALANEHIRRAREVRVTGSDRWCADKREMLGGIAGASVFRR